MQTSRAFAPLLLAVLTSLAPSGPLAATSDPADLSAVWLRRLPVDLPQLYGSAIDGQGNIYVAGYVRNLEKDDDDFYTMKLDPTGNVLWTRTYDHGGVEAWDWGYSVGVDAAGNAYVFGESWNGSDDDLEVIKYDPDGNLLWARIYDSGGQDDRAQYAVVDAGGSVYASAFVYEWEGMGNQIDALTLRWDPDGNLVWLRAYETGIHDVATTIAVGGDGNVTVGRCSWTTDGSGTGSQASTGLLRYSPAGDLLWTRTLTEATDTWWSSPALAADASGNTYVVTSSFNGVNKDVATSRLDPAGNVIWTRTFDQGGDEGVLAAAADGLGNLYVSASLAGNLPITLRYAPTGKLDWSGQWFGYTGLVLATDPRGAGFTLAGAAWPRDELVVIRYAPTDLSLTKNLLPAAVVGQPYSHTPRASGGVEPYSWSVADGSLPDGIALNPATGRISGTPTKVQQRGFAIQVTDARGARALNGFQLRVAYPLGIVTLELPPSIFGSAYAALLTPSGGGDFKAWRVVSGALPPGITLSTDGYVRGVAEALGTFTFTAEVADELGLTATRSYTVLVDWLDVSPTILADGVVGQPYQQLLSTSQGTAPYAWSLAGGALPAGLGLDPTTGSITGTPLAAGRSEFAVGVVDAGALDGTRRRAIEVNDLLEGWRASVAGDAGEAIFGVGRDADGHVHTGVLRYASGLAEVVVQERDVGGALLSTRSWAPGLAYFWGPVLGVGPDGTVGIAAGSWDGTRYGFSVAVLDPSGALRRTQLIENEGNCWPGSVVVSPSGELYVGGGAEEYFDTRNHAMLKVVAFDAAGGVRWTWKTVGFWTSEGALALDPSGALYVGGSAGDDDGTYPLLAKLAGDGTLLWSRTLSSGQSWWTWLKDVAIAPNGDVVAAGVVSLVGYDVMLARWSPTGDLRWTASLSPDGMAGYAHAVGVDGAGNTYLSSDASWLPFPAAAVSKFDPTGHRLWTKAVDFGPSDIAVDASGDLVLGGGTVVARFARVVP